MLLKKFLVVDERLKNSMNGKTSLKVRKLGICSSLLKVA
ncbi:hypothetical protein N42HA_00204 [Lactococcus lactis]|nr:hypothetical protein [Lactococcus lactis]